MRAVTKQELHKFPAEQNSTYQSEMPKKEINRKLFAKADSLVDKILSCCRIKLLYFKNGLKMDDVETKIILSDRKNADIADVYFNLPDATGMSMSLVLIHSVKAREEAGSLSKFERQKLQNLQGSKVLLMCLCAI